MPSGLSRLGVPEGRMAVAAGPAALVSGLITFNVIADADNGSSLQAPKVSELFATAHEHRMTVRQHRTEKPTPCSAALSQLLHILLEV